jgi:hypothetical protein
MTRNRQRWTKPKTRREAAHVVGLRVMTRGYHEVRRIRWPCLHVDV